MVRIRAFRSGSRDNRAAACASPGDVTYVLTSYYIIHAYLRDVGMHINNLQRSVNDMDELVAIHDVAIGVADAAGAEPIRVHGGRIVFEDVTFHYGGHIAPLYDGKTAHEVVAALQGKGDQNSHDLVAAYWQSLKERDGFRRATAKQDSDPSVLSVRKFLKKR